MRGPVLEDGILSGKVPAIHLAAGLRLPRSTSRPSRGARRVDSVAVRTSRTHQLPPRRADAPRPPAGTGCDLP